MEIALNSFDGDINALADQIAAPAWQATKSDVEKITEVAVAYLKVQIDDDFQHEIVEIYGFSDEVFMVSLKIGALCDNCDKVHWGPAKVLCIRRGDDFEALEPDGAPLVEKAESGNEQPHAIVIKAHVELPTMDLDESQLVHEDGTSISSSQDIPAWLRQALIDSMSHIAAKASEPHKAPSLFARCVAWLRAKREVQR